MGPDAYLLACGAPILPSLGLCNALRVGPDVAESWESRRDAILLYNPTIPGVKNAIRTTINRLWLHPLVAVDPDVAYFRSQHNALSQEHKRTLADLALVCNFKATSDLPQWLSAEEREELRAFLEAEPQIERTGRYKYSIDGREVDFSPAIPLLPPSHGLDALASAFLGWLGNQRWALKIMDSLGKRELQKVKKDL
jgi:alpha-galactosidase